MIDQKLEDEVRAKIFWGEPTKEILADLDKRGIEEEQARKLISALEGERDGCVRELGRKKIFIGLLLVPVPFVTWYVLELLHFVSFKVLAVGVAVGLYGLTKIVFGFINICVPQAIRVDLSDESAR
jgi:hypothetical protein